MNCRVRARRAAILVVAMGLAVGALFWGGSTPTASAMACFTVADHVSCVDTPTWVPVVPIFPRVIVPVSPVFEGEDEHVVIRDDGGRHVARG